MGQSPETELDDLTTSTIIWPTDGKEMVFIPGGAFIMGSNHGDPIYQPEQLLRDFYICWCMWRRYYAGSNDLFSTSRRLHFIYQPG